MNDVEWKYIPANNGRAYDDLTDIELGNSEVDQLYNLKNDRGEKVNLATQHPEVVARLKAILQKEQGN